MTVPFPKLHRQLVAILRGVKPDEALAIGAAVFEAGIEAIEVPLNSPDPFRSIELLARSLPHSALVGAGTVLTPAEVDDLHNAGGRLLVSPNIDRSVMERAVHHGMVTMPGVFTPTEAFLALSRGASALKFFPAIAHERHLGDQGRAAKGDDRRRGGRRLREGFCRLRKNRRLHLRPRLQPLYARPGRRSGRRPRACRRRRMGCRLRKGPRVTPL